MLKKTFMQRIKGLAAILTSLVIVGSNTISANAAADYEYSIAFIESTKSYSGHYILNAVNWEDHVKIKAGDKIISAAKLNVNVHDVNGAFPKGDHYILHGGETLTIKNTAAVAPNCDVLEHRLFKEGVSGNLILDSQSAWDYPIGESGKLYTWYPAGLISNSGAFYGQTVVPKAFYGDMNRAVYENFLRFIEVAEIDYTEDIFELGLDSGNSYSARSVEEDGHTYFATSTALSGKCYCVIYPGGEEVQIKKIADGSKVLTINISEYISSNGKAVKLDVFSFDEGIKIRLVHKDTHTVTPYVANASTCTSAGNKSYYFCETCKEYFSDEACTQEVKLEDMKLQALGHRASKKAAVAATCTTAGNKEYYYCDACKKYFEDGACTKEITKAQTEVKALGHKWDNGTVTLAATEDKAGVKIFKCTNAGCSETKTETIPAIGHKTHVKDEGTRVEPTCTEKGSVTYKCKICGEFIETVELKATGHDWNSGKVLKKPTLTKKGSIKYTCKTCKETKTETLAKLKKQAITVDKKVNKTVTLKVKNLKKKKVTLNIKAKAKTTLSYKLTSGNKKYASVSKAGVITFKKGTRAGIYEFTVTAAESLKYAKATKKIVVKVK